MVNFVPDNYFNQGCVYVKKAKYDKAINEFLKCVESDPIYLDAYYNLAFCYQQIGKKNLACEIWNKLKNIGQKQGEYLFEENCR